jgi:L-asparaginase / beta-aspartyl-peptidase
MMAILRPALILHGGAGLAHPERQTAQRAGCTAALAAGWSVLIDGGNALDAAVSAVAVLEDAPAFNAGLGSCLTSTGVVEMDATVMDGSTLCAGAVGAVRGIRNPVCLARAILDDGRHVMLAGCEAEAFARAHGVPTCAPESLITASQRQRWQERRDTGAMGTVGAAAVDRAGHVAAATSTGGIFYKLPGRVGDSAVIGAGTYADDALGAASATGHGEAIIRVVLAKSVVDDLGDGSDPAGAAHGGIQRLERRVAGSGGIIVVDALGRFGYACNTAHMTVAYMRPDLAGFHVHV